MSDEYDAEYEAEQAELAARQREHRRHIVKLTNNPNCRDPDHPGCENCAEDDE